MPATYAADSILRDHQARIYRLALSISRNEKDAEDILQNTLIKIARNLPRFRGRSSISTWIYRIAYNESLMFLRKRRRQRNSLNAFNQYSQKLLLAPQVSWARLPGAQMRDQEFRGRIDAAIKDIPIQYRMPLLLHRMEGLPLAECSRILAVPLGAVKTRLHRAYLLIREAIAEYDKDKPVRKAREEAHCGVWQRFLFQYAQDALPTPRKAAFDRHMRGCPRCNTFLSSYLKAIRITRELECKDIPPGLKQAVEGFLSRHKK